MNHNNNKNNNNGTVTYSSINQSSIQQHDTLAKQQSQQQIQSQSHSQTEMRINYYKLLIPQCWIGFVDAISFMIVAPSLVFYIISYFHGTKEQYGIILSSFSFASFLFKPIFGYWCDTMGTKFRIPYLSSILLAAFGGILYFYASFYTGPIALVLVLISRFLGGIGAANSTLGFTYIACVIPHDQLTKATAILSMVRIFGMAIAPGLNIFLSKVHGIHIFSIEITPLNSIGLFLFVLNMISVIVIYILQKEPSDIDEISTSFTKNGSNSNNKDSDNDKSNSNNKQNETDRGWEFWKSLVSIDILVPIICNLSMNASFQLLETGLAPASSHALHWTPVQISAVFGFNALWIFVILTISFYLSSIGVSDVTMLIIGSIASTIGYTCMYLFWSMNASSFHFILPIVIATISFPFMGAPARSLFTKVIDTKPYLRNHQGTMQAIMSMAASVAGFVAPGLIASFVLRTPEQVETSIDQRELTSYALFAPISSLIAIIGVLYIYWYPSSSKDNIIALNDDEEIAMEQINDDDELTNLLPIPNPNMTHASKVRRRSMCDSIMGLPELTFSIETEETISRSSF